MTEIELMPKSGNVYFMGVSRLKDKILVGSHQYRSIVDFDTVRKMLLELPGSMPDSQLHAFTTNNQDFSWFLMPVAKRDVLLVMSTQAKYPARIAMQCLLELQRLLEDVDDDKIQSAVNKSLDNNLKKLFSSLCNKYDNLCDVSEIHKTMDKVDTLKLKMEENIQLQLDNCVALEDIQEQTEGLMEKAGVFRKNAKTLKKTMKCKDHKMTLIIAGIALLIIFVIVMSVCGSMGCFDNDDE